MKVNPLLNNIKQISKGISFCAVNVNPKYRGNEAEDSDIITQGLKRFKKADVQDKLRRNNDRYSNLTKCRYKTESDGFWYSRQNIQQIQDEAAKKDFLAKEQTAYAKELKAIAEQNAVVVQDIERQVEAREAARIKELERLALYRNSSYLNDKGFDRIAGYDREKEILKKYFISQIENEKRGQKAIVPNAVLFFGPKGNGKTTFATVFAEEIGCERPIKILTLGANIPSICEKFHKNLLRAAQKAEEIYQQTGNRQVIFIDEIINVANDKSTILPKLEDFIVNCADKYHCIVFAATNYPLNIALPIDTNENIFPYIVSVDPPDLEDKAKILQYYLRDKLSEPAEPRDFIEMAQMLKGKEDSEMGAYSIAKIKEIVTDDNPSMTTIEEVKQRIAKSSPNISANSLEDFYDARIKLMQNEVI